jgi:membrane carboxypeptidase/penicillin-binding protein PbpC
MSFDSPDLVVTEALVHSRNIPEIELRFVFSRLGIKI